MVYPLPAKFEDVNGQHFISEADGAAFSRPQLYILRNNFSVINNTGESFQLTRLLVNGQGLGGSAEFINDDDLSNLQLLDFAEENNITSLSYEVNGRSITSYFDVNGQHFISKADGDAFDPSQLYIWRQDFSVANKMGQSFQLSGIDVKGQGLDGSATFMNDVLLSNQQLLNLAKENNITSLSYEIDGRQITSYFDVNGQHFISEADGEAFDRAQLEIFWQNSYIAGEAGQWIELSGLRVHGQGLDGLASFISDVQLSDRQILNLAKSNNFDALSYQVAGRQITSYFDVYGQNIISEMDGEAFNRLQLDVRRENSSVVNQTGQNFQMTRMGVQGQGLNGSAAFINADYMSNPQLLNFVKENNVPSLSYQINERTITSYFDAVGGGIISEADGEILDRSQLFVSRINMPVLNQEGRRFEQLSKIGIQGQDLNGKDIYFLSDVQQSDQQLLDFAKANNFYHENYDIEGRGTLTGYFSNSYGRSRAGFLFGSLNGYLVSSQEYISHPEYQIPGTYSPIALDLEGDGIDSVSAENGVQFDLLGTGRPVQTGWVTGDDALLALDRDGNGVIDSGKELFGNQWGAANGFEELAKFDENADSVIDSRDAVFGGLRLWRDVNMNGVSEAGEMKTLKESRLGGITITYNEIKENNAGNEIRQVGSFTREDGSTGTAADIWFRFQDLISRRDLV